MDKAIFGLFDKTADDVLAYSKVSTLSIEGAYSHAYRDSPNLRGLTQFMSDTATIAAMFESVVLGKLQGFQVQSMLLRTAVDPTNPDAPETAQIAAQQLRNIMESLRLLSGRRFRAALVGRHSIAPPSSESLRVMSRAGQGIKADDAFWLTSRKAAIDMFNEGQAAGLLNNGVKVAHVFTLDPESPIAGAPVLLDGSMSGIPSYVDVQDKWFHPRSNAVLIGAV